MRKHPEIFELVVSGTHGARHAFRIGRERLAAHLNRQAPPKR